MFVELYDLRFRENCFYEQHFINTCKYDFIFQGLYFYFLFSFILLLTVSHSKYNCRIKLQLINVQVHEL